MVEEQQFTASQQQSCKELIMNKKIKFKYYEYLNIMNKK